MLVVGGSGSIGSEIAAEAAVAGWEVAIHGRTESSVEAAVEKLRTRAPAASATGFSADLRTPGAVELLVEQVGSRLGRIDAVVECMSTGPSGIIGRFDETDPDAYLELAAVSIVHLQRLARAALPWLSREGGALICFASDAGRFAARRQTMIGASRAAIMGFVRNLAVEVAENRVRVHCISPSFVVGSASITRLEASGMSRIEQARRRAGLGLPTPADIAPLVLFLCGPGAKRITGQIISVNGGLNA
ncbi:MAG: SDR family oxidoreductase [Rhodospirillaceae bacterium]|nr:MAG: SDR family oxidoreductase [Rhodospirillaceae bacterium]